MLTIYRQTLIRKYLPEQSNNYQKRLFKYPGQLSSFSAKIELSYAFRLINKRTFNALNALREIRNQAAHSSTNFDIKSVNFERIFDWGDGFQTLVHEVSGKMLIKFKFEQVKQMLVEDEDKTEDEAARIVAEKMQEPETHELLENQWPQWKLILGLSIICGIIQFYSEEIQESILDINTIGQISRNNDD